MTAELLLELFAVLRPDVTVVHSAAGPVAVGNDEADLLDQHHRDTLAATPLSDLWHLWFGTAPPSPEHRWHRSGDELLLERWLVAPAGELSVVFAPPPPPWREVGRSAHGIRVTDRVMSVVAQHRVHDGLWAMRALQLFAD